MSRSGRPGPGRCRRWVRGGSLRALAALLLGMSSAGCAATGPASTPSASTWWSVAPQPTTTATGSDGYPAGVPTGVVVPPPGIGLARYERQTVRWEGCGGPLECAWVRVPLDYAAPDDAAITLLVARRPVAGGRPGSAVLAMNPGGPGGSGVAFLRGFDWPGFGDVELVSWDPRGGGASTPVRCWSAAEMARYDQLDETPDTPTESDELHDAQRRFGAACLAASGTLLAHLSTAETVRDLDIIRAVLGVPALDYLGYSNGTLIGAGYAQLFPGRVRRMVLDGAVNVSGSPVTQPEGFERAFTAMTSWCARRQCPLGDTPDAITAQITGLWTRLDSHPLTADGRTLTQTLAVLAVLEALYIGAPGWAAVTDALTDAISAGRPGKLLALSDLLTGRRDDGSYDEFAYAFPASSCADTVPRLSLAEARARSRQLRQRAPVLGPFLGDDTLCALWPAPPGPALPHLTTPLASPFLVIGTTGDPATPYEWAVGMAGQLDAAILVTNDGDGHTSSRNPACVSGVVVPYLLSGRIPPERTRC